MSESISKRAAHARYLAAQPFLKQGQDLRSKALFNVLNDLRDAAPCDEAFVFTVHCLHEIVEHVNERMVKMPASLSLIVWRYLATCYAQLADLNEASLRAQDVAELKANAQPENGHE